MAAVDNYNKVSPLNSGTSSRPGGADSRSGPLRPFLEEIRDDIRDAVDYFVGEIHEDVERGLDYYHGNVDLPASEGRSKAVYTQVRDTIRNIKPSVMRVLCGSSSLVKYRPTSNAVAAAAEQQEAYVHQLFWVNGGYSLLLDMVDEALKCKMCPIKTYWEPNTAPTYAQLTMLTGDEVDVIDQMPDVEVLEIVENANSPIGGVEVFDIELEHIHHNGRIVAEAVPVNEFFISRNARSTKDAKVHGHQRTVTVGEAIELGIEYTKWWELDDYPLTDRVDMRNARKQPLRDEESERGDILSHKFLLTEAYISIDLKDADSNQLYCVYFGGSDYRFLGYYREPESPFDIAIPDPVAFSVYGQSIPDLMNEHQDVMTSLLRATIDNAHAANRPRIAGDPKTVNFDDLLHHEIDYPIRMKQGGAVQVIAIPSTLQGSLPLLQWLETGGQQKVGITNAAAGLDPDALQSTDKDAVKNTIMLAQGQVELMVRNLVHTAIVPMFRKMLRLSIQHMDRYQVVRMKGQFVPVDQLLFDPNLYCEPVVGLGTKGDEQKAMGLQFTLEKQLFILERLGMDNPFVNSAHIYNALEDMTKIFGLFDVNRYWNHVTPEMEKEFKDRKQKEAASQKQPMDPGEALIQTEQIKAGVEKFKIVSNARVAIREQQFKALEANAKDDLERDRLTQDRRIKSADILGKVGVKIDELDIKREQAAQREKVIPLPGGSEGGPQSNPQIITTQVPQPVEAPTEIEPPTPMPEGMPL